ncbi:L-threonylcarbamoyladenylate synthase [Acinetobacter beijerinckii]|jgi:L-threonylcarbamoyladenylate synthase|uniref:Threonylcarbamoyl-AMP synthase n=2 Tax=Acinetobacter beijerinckii TaxID=262668 RepID=N9FF28_9GAMM|nr:Sua5/YciO/YrdC/YwlC family protein [Acinetobacter beijerinckii]ENW03469.1 tRNA threonylcarbamoyladenosine biosynthesis protein RimN [Acinetobacter beijerinckii ANC 3835]ENW06256.1 tRNA threonylcarbamoyladenosine biosynthesis protein RimN [Acinetobacter beijerinckii CIP 110307]MDF2418276.1 tRNA threonylcarbamoyladenosine biosynthesis protein RimN [Acinetobacter beijerinckii]
MITTSPLEAAQLLTQGQVLAYPTEAVWGLGCDPYNEQAFQTILELKHRPVEKGVILLAGHIQQVEHLLENLSSDLRKQIIASWSNRQATERATTWLLPADQHIPTWIKGQHPLVAVRVTTHPLCVQLCDSFGGFIVSTSANPAGLSPAHTLQQAQNYFGQSLNYLEGKLGLSQEPSRILNALTGEIIRA